MRLQVTPRSWIPLFLELFMYIVLNAATLYLFITRPFYWSDSSLVQRFMWWKIKSWSILDVDQVCIVSSNWIRNEHNYKKNRRRLVSISCRLPAIIHSYSPSIVSNVPFCIHCKRKVKRGPNSRSAAFFSDLNSYLEITVLLSKKINNGSQLKMVNYLWCLKNM